ncbi:MAG: hypothetical protein ABIH18_05715 [Candidatus Omnitrophota bacterium]
MKKLILGVGLFFFLMLSSNEDIFAQIKQLYNQKPLEVIIKTDEQVYKQFERIDIELEVKNTGEKKAKIFNPDYWGVSQIIITDSNGKKIKPQVIKKERSSFSDYMVISAGNSQYNIFKNLTWFDCDSALQYTGEQLIPGTYSICVTVTNPPKCDSKKYSVTSLSGNIVSNIITINIKE